MDQYRDFTNGELNYPVPAGKAFLERLHAAGQHYVPIVDSNIYAPDPTNASDIYDTFCLLYTSPSPRDLSTSRMPSSA